MPDFSLILATIGRSLEVEAFLESLDQQSFKSFEVIVVDQNQDEILGPILEHYSGRLAIRHLLSEPGVSRARNLGIEEAKGEILGFPDDDCHYPQDLLFNVNQLLSSQPDLGGVSGRVVDPSGHEYARFDSRSGEITKSNIWKRTSTVVLFIRTDAAQSVGGFDESLGPGADTLWGGAEDIDYPLCIIENGYPIKYDPSLVVYHPSPLKDGYEKAFPRAYTYGAGIGRVWRKHQYPLWIVAYHLIRPIGGALLGLAQGNRDKSKYHWNAFKGRLMGWSAPYDRSMEVNSS
jgi:glycosyltransferase involved in cell wall biosynthesis